MIDMKAFSKPVIFGVLAVLALGLAFIGLRSESHFFQDIWHELFWLIIGIIATTFILDAIIEEGQAVRRRNADAFAFRTFAVNLMHLLMRIKNMEIGKDNLMTSAINGKKEFAETFAKAVHVLTINENPINGDEYNNCNIKVGGSLTDFARNYIRLFCSSKEQMVNSFHHLTELANRWVYKGELVKNSIAYTNSLNDDDKDKATRLRAIAEGTEEVKKLLLETANYVADIVLKASIYKGMPAVN